MNNSAWHEYLGVASLKNHLVAIYREFEPALDNAKIFGVFLDS